MTLKISTIIGARPQFIKAAAVSREILKHTDHVKETIIHTGQHFDHNMSQVFFDELNIPVPEYNLEVSGGTHGTMTGKMLEGIEAILLKEKPDWVLVYGDTNSTLAGALAAVKLNIPLAHVEAGLRSFNMRMPEEINRIVADRISTLLLCPTQCAVDNLAQEGILKGVHNVGDVMYDAALYFSNLVDTDRPIFSELGIQDKSFALATCHRAENTDSPENLKEILMALSLLSAKMPVILPLHPRTKKMIDSYKLHHLLEKLTITEPLPFLDMVALEKSASLILTDSGGVQKEAFFYQVPCITMRNETEWTETVELGWNQLTGASCEKILNAYSRIANINPDTQEKPYGEGFASKKIVEILFETASGF